MHQNLAVILWQFNFGKNSFIVLILGDVKTTKNLFLPDQKILEQRLERERERERES